MKETIIKNPKYCELVELVQHEASKTLSGLLLSISVCLSFCLSKHSVLTAQIISFTETTKKVEGFMRQLHLERKLLIKVLIVLLTANINLQCVHLFQGSLHLIFTSLFRVL